MDDGSTGAGDRALRGPPEVVARRRPGASGSGSSNALLGWGLLFYACMAGLALGWRSFWCGEPVFFASSSSAREGLQLGRDLFAGLVAGSAVLAISWALTRGTRFGAELAHALSDALGGLRVSAAIALALASGIAEEMLFRGALQPRVGWLIASLVFGLVHFVPRKVFLPWTGFAILAGMLFGALFEWTGNLLAPVVAHVLVNAVNLPLLIRGSLGKAPPVRA